MWGWGMNFADIVTLSIAAYAAVVSTGALALEVRRWFESGPRLHLKLMPNAIIVGAGEKSNQSYVVATVINRGSQPTTITHMGYFGYRNTWDRIRGAKCHQAIVANPSSGFAPNVPHLIQPGSQWQGLGRYTPELLEHIKNGRYYVQIICSHRSKPLTKLIKMTPEDISKIGFGDGGYQ